MTKEQATRAVGSASAEVDDTHNMIQLEARQLAGAG